MPLIKLEHVNKCFGGVIAANDISFEVQPGQIIGLIGPNGAGKTTLLNLISGIYMCDSGKITFMDQDVTQLAPHKRARLGLARTFQTPHFLKRSSVKDNLLLGTDLAEKAGYLKSFFTDQGSDFETEVKELEEIAGFTIEWSMDISAIPYGKQKRLEIIRALLTHPKLVLIDEPAAGLNEKELEYVVKLIRYAAKKGIAVILIEHKMDMVMQISDYVVVLNFGKVIANGTPKEVSNNPEVIEAYLGRDYNAER